VPSDSKPMAFTKRMMTVFGYDTVSAMKADYTKLSAQDKADLCAQFNAEGMPTAMPRS